MLRLDYNNYLSGMSERIEKEGNDLLLAANYAGRH
jgi:hypothetical protein